MSSADIVIVGNGIAGLTAAVEARRFAPDLRIAIITEQSNPTINTPALKQFAMGKLERQQLLAYPVGTEQAQRIQMLQARVVEIDAQGKFVRLANGSAIGYGSLLLATGSAAVGLPTHLPGRDFEGVMTLHRLHDYMNLRRRLYEVEDVVVIEGTFDARTYFSQRHSIAVFDMAISGKKPVVRTTQRALPPVRSTLLERVSLSSLEKERAQANRPLSIVGSIDSVASVPVTPLPRPSASVQFRVIHSPTERR